MSAKKEEKKSEAKGSSPKMQEAIFSAILGPMTAKEMKGGVVRGSIKLDVPVDTIADLARLSGQQVTVTIAYADDQMGLGFEEGEEKEEAF